MKKLMQLGGASKATGELLTRPPATWQKIAAVALTVLLPLGLWDKRGATVGIVAVVVYGGMLLLVAFNYSGTIAWSRRHVVLDALVAIPLAFFALAYLTELALPACMGIAVAVGLLLVAVAVRRHRDGSA